MKRETGFTLIELLVSMTLMLIVVAAVLGALTDATHATQAVSLMADTQENLRAGMNYMVRDLMQAGNGIPQSGITIPNSGGASPTSNIIGQDPIPLRLRVSAVSRPRGRCCRPLRLGIERDLPPPPPAWVRT